mmetsp:Transcript_5233/g.10357  ORF Transcript_5233/g.10357 Transcript_5233/m.10357 type:complete len:132 (+) Transcript_5233:429-824(+)
MALISSLVQSCRIVASGLGVPPSVLWRDGNEAAAVSVGEGRRNSSHTPAAEENARGRIIPLSVTYRDKFDKRKTLCMFGRWFGLELDLRQTDTGVLAVGGQRQPLRGRRKPRAISFVSPGTVYSHLESSVE